MTRNVSSSLKLASLVAAGIFAFASVPHTAAAQVGVYIGPTPPPMRYEARPPAPGPGFAWVDGFYEPWQGGYRWHPGYWNQPPYAGAYWNHPHYDHYNEGWRFHEGYWGHEDHDDHHWEHRDHDHHDDRH